MISIVVPIYNEEENLRLLNKKLLEVLNHINEDFEIIYVNDGSTDNSLKILKEIKNNFDFIKIVNFKRNFGQTAAMNTGLKLAKGEWIITIDADLQNDPNDIPKLLKIAKEGNFDVVSGIREKRQDEFLRTFLSKIANKLIAYLTKVNISDYGCTLKVYKKQAIEKINLQGEMHRFIPAIISLLNSENNITEIPVNHNPRIYGQSKYGLERIFKVILDLNLIIFLKFFRTKPIYYFGFFSIIFFTIALLSLIFENKNKTIFVMLFISSILIFLMGLGVEFNKYINLNKELFETNFEVI